MKVEFENQRVLITGASAGIGLEMARQIAGRGVKHLILVARRQAELEALKQELTAEWPGLQVHVCACDLSDIAAIDGLLRRVSAICGAVDILINNAGLGDYSLFEQAEWAKLARIIDLNITGLTYLSHKLVNPMIALGRGAILNISSGFGYFFMPGMAVYAASKHYVTAFSEGLRAELRGTGVVVSQACPGPVASEFGSVANAEHANAKLPPGVMLSSAACARQILEGFAKGKAVIMPGALVRTGMRIGLMVPRPLVRLALSGMRGRLLRESAPPAPLAAEVGA